MEVSLLEEESEDTLVESSTEDSIMKERKREIERIRTETLDRE